MEIHRVINVHTAFEITKYNLGAYVMFQLVPCFSMRADILFFFLHFRPLNIHRWQKTRIVFERNETLLGGVRNVLIFLIIHTHFLCFLLFNYITSFQECAKYSKFHSGVYVMFRLSQHFQYSDSSLVLFLKFFPLDEES